MREHRRVQPTRFRLDPEQLRHFRQCQGWTQAELARRTEFSEDYISQLERARKTANKGTKLETLCVLARALQVPVEDLLEGSDQEQEDADREQEDSEAVEGAGDTVSSRLPGQWEQPEQTRQELVQRLLLLRPVLASDTHPYLRFPRSREDEVLKTLTADADSYVRQSRWLQAERRGLQARSYTAVGSEAWARMTLWYGAQMRQQAGDVTQAEAYLREVEEQCLQHEEAANPQIASMLHITRAWLEIEQYGHFERALRSLNAALTLMRQWDITDREWNQRVHSFRFRVISEIAMTEGGAWIGAWPTHPLAPRTIQYLHQSLQDDHQKALALDPENPNTFYRRAIVDRLLHPADARRNHQKLSEMARQTGTEYVWALHLANWRFSEGEWEFALGHAEEAFYGYGIQGFPPGTALASAVAGHALLRNGITSMRTFQRCIDYLVLALMLHPYGTHPLFEMTRQCLKGVVGRGENAPWLQAYVDHLEGRIVNGSGSFHILDHMQSAAINTALPLRFIHSLFPNSAIADSKGGQHAIRRSTASSAPSYSEDLAMSHSS